MRIGFLGYGEAARAFHDGLARAVLAYDILLEGDEGGMAAEMKLHGASPATLAGLAEADWIFSAVTADQSFVAVETLLPHLRQGQVLIDINSVSPGRKRETAAAVEAAGARYLDMAVMAPVQPKKHATPVLLAGECAAEMLPDLLALGFSARVIGAEPGAATAIKMVRSLFVKGLEAITVETLLAAEASGCFEEIFVSLSTSFPGLDWSRFADYQFERTMRHGKRRAAEMDESAATLDGLGLHGALAREIAAVQAAMGAEGVMPQAGTDETVQQALRRRLGQV
jgi:3-hydroxyisobutyrate dehydrogenase-like beta-hydroxyacid dehydrogenase